jgi:hypothetical protein
MAALRGRPASGTLITVQTGANAQLKEAFGETLPAVIVSDVESLRPMAGARDERRLVGVGSTAMLGQVLSPAPS